MDEKGFKNNRKSSIAQKLLGHCAGYFNLWISGCGLQRSGFDFVKESLSDDPVEAWGPVAWTILAVGATIILIWTVIMILVRIFIGNMIETGRVSGEGNPLCYLIAKKNHVIIKFSLLEEAVLISNMPEYI